MQDNRPLDVIFFEMEVNICERFPSLSPLKLRKEKARDVFALFVKYANLGKKKKKKQVIRKPAGDNWF